MQLTKQQLNFFDTFGYLKFEGLFADDIARIEAAFAETISCYEAEMWDWQHRAHYEQQRRFLPQFIDRHPYLSGLIDDPRIHGILASLLGEDFSYRGSDANLFNCSTCWHSDTYGALFKYRNVKIAFYLDDLAADSGCFRVIPGSQHFGDKFSNKLQSYLGKSDSFLDGMGLQDHEVPCQVIPTKPGDMLVFDFRVKHATCFGSDRLRRMFTICAAETVQEQDIPDLRRLISESAKHGFTRYYGEQMVRTASPERMLHLQQCLDNEDALAGV